MTSPIKDFQNLIDQSVEHGASDLHISSNATPYVRVRGCLEILGTESLSASRVEQLALELMQPGQQEVFQQQQTMDLAYTHETSERFRINVFCERGQVALAVRHLDSTLSTIDELHLPAQLNDLVKLQDGLVLVTGATGSGKTTTLATLIHQINCNRACHIITVEDPVEYLHANRQGLVHQRELYRDVPTFAAAVRAALREDPDVILIGEMRDTDTMRAAITAAETGHLVFSTLHTGDAVGALDRMLGGFPAAKQDTIRHQLSMILQAVVAQRLLACSDGQGRAPAVEILRINTAVSNLIRTGRFDSF